MPDNLDSKRADAFDKAAQKPVPVAIVEAPKEAPKTVTMRVARGRTVHIGATIEEGVGDQKKLVTRAGKHTFAGGERVTLPMDEAAHLMAAGFLHHDEDQPEEKAGLVSDAGPLSIHQKAR